MNEFIHLMRINQWYKNLVVFLALFFTKNLFNPELLVNSVLAFISLSFMSSSYYILNDIKDKESDRNHPEKKNRPIASGAVSVRQGQLLSALLFVFSSIIAYNISIYFLIFPLLLFLFTQTYTMFLKDIAFVDIHLIALNYLVRAISGAVVINVPASPWLIMTVFFLALLLGIGKRRSELSILGDDAVKFKKVYSVYTPQVVDMLLVVISSILLFAYSLYTFSVHEEGYMMLTIPFPSFIIFRYLHLASVNHEITRKAEHIFFDTQILVSFSFWVITSFLVIYLIGF